MSQQIYHAKELAVSIPGHTLEFEEDFKREIEVYVKEPSNGVNENTGVFLILHPGTGCSDDVYYQKLRKEWSDRYNVVAIGVNYLGTKNRFFYYEVHPQWTPEAIDILLSLLPPQIRQAMMASDSYIETKMVDPNIIIPHLSNIDATDKLKVRETIPHRERADYRDYGYIQAIDCLYAVKYALDLYDKVGSPLNRKRIFVFGSCLGGHLAQQCAKFAPGTFSLVVDNSGFVYMNRHFLRTTLTNNPITYTANKFKYTLLQEPYYSDDPKSKYFLSEDMIKIRNMTELSHLKVFAKYFEGRLFLLHGEKDTTINVKERIFMHELFDSVGIDNSLRIFTEEDVDGVIINSAGHSMNANIKLMFEKFCEELVIEENQSLIKKENTTDFDKKHVITYPGARSYHTIDFSGDYPKISLNKFQKKEKKAKKTAGKGRR